MLAPCRLISPSAWNPSSQNMAAVTVSPWAVRARPVLAVQVRAPEVSWPPMLAPSG